MIHRHLLCPFYINPYGLNKILSRKGNIYAKYLPPRAKTGIRNYVNMCQLVYILRVEIIDAYNYRFLISLSPFFSI